MRKITDVTKHARVSVLVDKLEGYPKDATYRGDMCPPAPFGRTLTYSVPIRDPAQAHPGEGHPDNRPLVYLLPDEIISKVNDSENLAASERVELAAIAQLGEATPEGRAKGFLHAK